jgi:hypothetical protein
MNIEEETNEFIRRWNVSFGRNPTIAEMMLARKVNNGRLL